MTSTTHMAKILLDYYIMLHEILLYFLSSNKARSDCTLLLAICRFLGIKQLRATAHHWQTDYHAERCKTLLTVRSSPSVTKN